jgi:Holliday junction resolvasome RuvABC endonuclease subunit
MRIIGIDPASSAGYAILDCNRDGAKFVEGGQITCQSDFTLPQKLNFIHTYLQNIFERVKPNVCAIEEPPLSISGVKVLIHLARINGVVIQSAFDYLRDKIWIYSPSQWKANSFNGLIGSSPKWKIQLEVCRYFGVRFKESSLDYNKIDSQVSQIVSKLNSNKQSIIDIKKNIDDLKKQITRKRQPLNDQEKLVSTNKLTQLVNTFDNLKSEEKQKEKLIDKELAALGIDICARSGITSDIADATSIAFCLYKELLLKDESTWTNLTNS